MSGVPRTAFLVYEGTHRSDGGVTSLSHILDGMDPTNCCIITNRYDGRAGEWRAMGYRVHVVQHWRDAPTSVGKAIRLFVNGFRLASLLRSEGAEVVHLNDIMPLEQGWPLMLWSNRVLMLNVRDVKTPASPYGVKWKVAARRVDHILALSEEMVEQLARRLPLGAGSPVLERDRSRKEEQRDATRPTVSYIYSVVPWLSTGNSATETESPHSNGPAGKCLLYVGAVCEKKGHLNFLAHAAEPILSYSDAHICFIGDFRVGSDWYADACYAQARRLKHQGRLRFAGHVDAVQCWYREAYLAILPSRNEGLPRSMIESLSSGTPMVMFDVASAHEIVTRNEAGVVIPQGDYIAFAQAVCRVLHDESLRSQMSEKALETSRRLFQGDAIRSEYLELLRALKR